MRSDESTVNHALQPDNDIASNTSGNFSDSLKPLISTCFDNLPDQKRNPTDNEKLFEKG